MTRSTKFRLLVAVVGTLGLLASLLGPVATPASAVADVQTERLGGADRFATAAEVARESHPSAQTALIANGMNFPDALAGSTLAGAVNAPILLVTPTSIPAATSSALTDIGVNDVVILGGPNAVSPQVEAQLRQNYGVTRVEGADRYQTAVAIARRAAVGGVGTVDGLRTALISTGLNFPDALGAGPLAYEGNLPSLLTRTNDLPAEAAQFIRDLNIEHVVILGGTQAVSATVEAQIEATGASTERLNGRNRAETATLVADFAVGRMDFDGVNVILARGDNFPDALAGGPLGGERRAVILLTATPCQLAIETRTWLEEHFGTVARIFVLGGPAAICDAVVREAEGAAETNNLPPDQVQLTISGGSTNGGPKWQYQEEDASPSKSLTLSAFVSADPSGGEDREAEPVPTAREDVIFNIKPSEGDPEGNTELNLPARTDSNGVARVTYTRSNPGTDIITVRLRDDSGITDDGVGRWDSASAPILLDPNETARLEANQPREFTVTLEGTSPTARQVNLTTLELVDDIAGNDTNKGALTFEVNGDPPPVGPAMTDDRADGDQTLAIVTVPAGQNSATFTVTSSAAQIFTLMAFLDSVNTPAANDDNTNPPEFRDIAGATAFTSNAPGLVVTPANDDDDTTAIQRRNGQQIVYTVTAVDEQGEPYSGPIDVSFEELVDDRGTTTTNAEFDWFDNSASPSTQEGGENQIPPGATAAPSGTTRLEVLPNADGTFTFAVVQPTSRVAPTTGTPIAWIDLTGGVNNRPDATEPRARGENFVYATGSAVNATLEVLGCPPGTDQRGYPGGNNPFEAPDPCLGMDQPEDTTAQAHVPWRLDVAAESDSAHAGTCGNPVTPEAESPGLIGSDPSRGDVVFRFTLRDPQGRRIRDNPDTLSTNEAQRSVTFRVSFGGDLGQSSAAVNRPNRLSNQNNLGDCSAPTTTIDNETGEHIVNHQTRNGVAEIVVDRTVSDSSSAEADFNTATVEVVRAGFGTEGFACASQTPPVGSGQGDFCVVTATWADIEYNTASASPTEPSGDPATVGAAPATSCPSPLTPCYNGALVGIDKARDYYVMQRGGSFGGHAYVVYAAGGGGEPYNADVAGTTPSPRPPLESASAFGGERPTQNTAGARTVDEYFIDGAPAPPDNSDNFRCGYFTSMVQAGCARFEAAMTFDDRMVYEWAGTAPTRTQTHFLTNGTAPIGD